MTENYASQSKKLKNGIPPKPTDIFGEETPEDLFFLKIMNRKKKKRSVPLFKSDEKMQRSTIFSCKTVIMLLA